MVRLTDRHDMAIAVYLGHKTTKITTTIWVQRNRQRERDRERENDANRKDFLEQSGLGRRL